MQKGYRKGYSRNNTGIFLAIIAGVYCIAVNVWAGATQYGEFHNMLWVAVTILIGIGYIASAVVVDRSKGLAKTILVAGAIIQIGSAIIFGGLLDGGLSPILIDLFPALLALVSAAIIGPRQMDTIM